MNRHSRHATTLVLVIAVIGGARHRPKDLKSPQSSKAEEPGRGDAGVARRREAAYDTNCAACHGNMAQGAVKAGVVISIIQEQGGKQPPDLTDGQRTTARPTARSTPSSRRAFRRR